MAELDRASRWIGKDGELVNELNPGTLTQEEIKSGLEQLAVVFRPGKVDNIKITIEGWKNIISASWSWRWDLSSFVGGIIYRYSFDGVWSCWDINRSFGYSPGHSPGSSGGIGVNIEKYDSFFQIEMALLGLFCITRGPIVRLAGKIPPKEKVPTDKPALLLHEMHPSLIPDDSRL